MRLRKSRTNQFTLVILVSFCGVALGHDDNVLILGRSLTGKLTVLPQIRAGVLSLSPVSGNIIGCASISPGVVSLAIDLPANDMLMLEPNSMPAIELLSLQPALHLRSPDLTEDFANTGPALELGAPPFDTHLVWHIDSTDPIYDPDGQYTVMFRFVDNGATAYQASDSMTLTFECGRLGACCESITCGHLTRMECGNDGGIFHGDSTVCPGSNDGDTIDDLCDNCPDAANEDQADEDSDGAGDACDLCPADPIKQLVGTCGCGIPDADENDDGVIDCLEQDNDDRPMTAPCAMSTIPAFSLPAMLAANLFLLAGMRVVFGRRIRGSTQ